MVKKDNRILLLIFFSFIGLIFSCSPGRFNKVATFFFDGVPVKDTVSTQANEKVLIDTSITVLAPVESVAQKSGYKMHYPYKENECSSCHDKSSGSELVMEMPGLCYTCHDDFTKLYKSVHGPVSSGYCTMCHNPHMSKENSLLIRTGQQLCLYCHDAGTVLQNDTHKDIADSECTLCHNPHGGEDRFLMN